MSGTGKKKASVVPDPARDLSGASQGMNARGGGTGAYPSSHDQVQQNAGLHSQVQHSSYGEMQYGSSPHGQLQSNASPYGQIQHNSSSYDQAQYNPGSYGRVQHHPSPYDQAQYNRGTYGQLQHHPSPYGSIQCHPSAYGQASDNLSSYAQVQYQPSINEVYYDTGYLPYTADDNDVLLTTPDELYQRSAAAAMANADSTTGTPHVATTWHSELRRANSETNSAMNIASNATTSPSRPEDLRDTRHHRGKTGSRWEKWEDDQVRRIGANTSMSSAEHARALNAQFPGATPRSPDAFRIRYVKLTGKKLTRKRTQHFSDWTEEEEDELLRIRALPHMTRHQQARMFNERFPDRPPRSVEAQQAEYSRLVTFPQE